MAVDREPVTHRVRSAGGPVPGGSPAGDVRVVPVRGRRGRRRFAIVGRAVHAGTAQHVPPLDSSVVRFIDPKRNPFFAEARIEHFLALVGDEVLGRISATVEDRYVAARGPVGWFGWLDCVDRQDVADALLRAAESWLRDQGMPRVEGPYSYNATQEFGLLTSGFDRVPAVLQPHHEAYYDPLLRNAGYAPRYGTRTYTWTAQDADVLAPVSERGRRTAERHGLRVRPLDRSRRAADIDVVWDLFVSTFADQHDMIPMTRAVFDWQLADFKGFIDPRLVRIVEQDGEPIAFSLLAADANEVLAVAGGRAGPGFLLRYPWLRRRVRGTVVLMVGVRPGKEGTGAGRVLAGCIADVALGRVGPWNTVHTTWIHDDNASSVALVRRTGAAPTRTYAVYGKEL